MAPSTRLQATPSRRVNYAELSSVAPSGTRANPIIVDGSPEPRASQEPRRRIARPRRSVAAPRPQSLLRPVPTHPQPAPGRVPRVKAGAVAKPKKERAPRPRQECLICAGSKVKSRSFKKPDDACKHFKAICNSCVSKMLKTKLAERQLGKAELVCPFDNCEHELDFAALQAAVTGTLFEPVTKYALSASNLYISCLSPECGRYFSIEDCKKKTRPSAKSIACPYCNYEICPKCNRSLESHAGGECDKAKEAEDAKSEAMLKKLGAKPCPKCGIKIEKNGGCDHMKCQNCRYNFCWTCLVEYRAGVQHIGDCPQRTANIAHDPRNWVPPNLDNRQIVALIDRAHAHGNVPGNVPAPPHGLTPAAAHSLMRIISIFAPGRL